MKSRMVWVVLVAGAVAVLWLLKRAGVDIPSHIWTILIAGFGVLGLLAGLLLKLGIVRPNAFWGYSPLGTTLMGCAGLVLAGFWGSSEPALGEFPEAVLVITFVVLSVAGLVLNRKARQERKAPASE